MYAAGSHVFGPTTQPPSGSVMATETGVDPPSASMRNSTGAMSVLLSVAPNLRNRSARRTAKQESCCFALEIFVSSIARFWNQSTLTTWPGAPTIPWPVFKTGEQWQTSMWSFHLPYHDVRVVGESGDVDVVVQIRSREGLGDIAAVGGRAELRFVQQDNRRGHGLVPNLSPPERAYLCRRERLCRS